MKKFKCMECDRDATYVTIVPWATLRFPGLNGSLPKVIVHCKPCAIADEEAGRNHGYWFEIKAWYRTVHECEDWNRPGHAYTMREHLRDTKDETGLVGRLVEAALNTQRRPELVRPEPAPVQRERKPRARPAATTTVTRRAISQRRRYAILQRDDFTCQLCRRSAEMDSVPLEVDHQQPVSKGGLDTDANLWTLCRDCNQGKSDSL